TAKSDAPPLPLRTDGPVRGVILTRADSTRGIASLAQQRRSHWPTPGLADSPSSDEPAPDDAPYDTSSHPFTLEWRLFRDGHQFRRWPQHLWPGRDTLA